MKARRVIIPLILVAMLVLPALPSAYAWVQVATFQVTGRVVSVDASEQYVAILTVDEPHEECVLYVLSLDNLSLVKQHVIDDCMVMGTETNAVDVYKDVVAVIVSNVANPLSTNADVYIYNVTSDTLMRVSIYNSSVLYTYDNSVAITKDFVIASVTHGDENGETDYIYIIAPNGTILSQYRMGYCALVDSVDGADNMIVIDVSESGTGREYGVVASVGRDGSLNVLYQYESLGAEGIDAVYDPQHGVIYVAYATIDAACWDYLVIDAIDVTDTNMSWRRALFYNFTYKLGYYLADLDLTPAGHLVVCADRYGVYRYDVSQSYLYKENLPDNISTGTDVSSVEYVLTNDSEYVVQVDNDNGVVIVYRNLCGNIGGTTTVTQTVTETVTQPVMQYETETETETVTVQGPFSQTDLALVGVLGFVLALAVAVLLRR